MPEKQYDIAILGGGPAGYVAAIYAAKRGMSVALVERDRLGGTCLHRGCIPSKALLKSAALWAQCKNADAFGISMDHLRLDYARAAVRAEQVVSQLHKGVEQLIKKNKIDVFRGTGRIAGPSIFSPVSGAIRLSTDQGDTHWIVPRHVLIATGTRPRPLPGVPFDGLRILSTDDALALRELPKRLAIIGGNAWAIEFASMYSDFGVETTVVAPGPQWLPDWDGEVAAEIQKQFGRRNVTACFVESQEQLDVDVQGETVYVRLRATGSEPERVVATEKVIVSLDRLPNTDELGLDHTDIQTDRGFILTDAWMRTREKHIFAAGDVAGGGTAQAAVRQGMVAVETIAGASTIPWNPHLAPRCLYARPSAASIGWTEEEARAAGIPLRIGRFPFRGLGQSLLQGEYEGFVKLIANQDTEDILGIHIVGGSATEMISEAGLMKLLNATPWEARLAIRPHPSFSEAFLEAALDMDGAAIHR
jgi:dihydrolipoamide dehydrogenase